MKILFITSNRLGDAVLSSGLLDYISQTYPDAKITIACGGLATSLFEAVPNRAEIYVLKKQNWNRHWIGLWKAVIGTKWDIVVDLRDSAVSRLIFAKKRYVFSRQIDKSQHKVKQVASVMGLDKIPAPRLWITEEQDKKACELVPDGAPVLGIGPTANWIGKTWPAESFIELIKVLTAKDGLMPHARVAVFAAPGEEEAALQVINTIPENRRIDVIAKTDPGTAAAVIDRCDFYVGNDSGLMHCAAAAGTPTVGLFGPTKAHVYRPYGDHCTFAHTPESYEDLTGYEGFDVLKVGSLMTSLTVDAVLDASQKLLQK